MLNGKIPLTIKDGRVLIITFSKENTIDYLLNTFLGKTEMFNKAFFRGYIFPEHITIPKTVNPKFSIGLNRKLSNDFRKTKTSGLAQLPYIVHNSIRMMDKSFINESSQDILNGELIHGATNYIFDISPFWSIIDQQKMYVDKVAAYEIFKELISTVSNSFDKVIFMMDDFEFNYKSMRVIKKTTSFKDRFKKDLLLDPVFIKDILLFRTKDSKYLIYEDKISLKRFNKKDKIDINEFRKFTIKLNMLKKLTENHNDDTDVTLKTKETLIKKLWKTDSKINRHGLTQTEIKSIDSKEDEDEEIIKSNKLEFKKSEVINTVKNQETLFDEKSIKEIKIQKLFDYLNDEGEKSLDDTKTQQNTKKVLEKIKKEHENMKVLIGTDSINAKDLLNHNAMDIKIKSNDYSDLIPTKAAHTKNVNFAKQYITSDTYYADIYKMFNQLSEDKDNPIYITNMEINDKSDTESSLQEITYTLKTVINGKEQKRTDRFIIPKLDANSEFKIQTTKYRIQNTMIPLPITKTKSDEVIVSTLYNKLMIQRQDKGNPKISGLSVAVRKKVNSGKLDVIKGKSFEFGHYKTRQTVFLSELGSIFLRFNGPTYSILPNRSRLSIAYQTKFNNDNNHQIDMLDKKGYVPFGFDKKGNLLVMNDQEEVEIYNVVSKTYNKLDMHLEKFIANQFDINIEGLLTDLKTYSYAKVKIYSNSIPIIFLLGLGYNITDILKKLKVKYKLFNSNSTKNLKLNFPSKMAKKIQLLDGVLYVEDTIQASLLLSGLQVIDTKKYRAADMAKFGAMYTDFFYNDLGIYVKGVSTLKKFIYMMIDPITADILKDMKIEPDFLSVMVEVLRLLSNNAVNAINDMTDRRVRPGSELVPSFIYRQLLNVLEKYKDTSNKISLRTFGIKNKAVLENITSSANVSPSKNANPSNEAEEQAKVSYVGPVGGFGDGTMVNKNFREYHKSMDGIIGGFSPDSSKVGADRALSSNPAIKNVRGMVNVGTIDYKNGTEIYAMTENIIPFMNESDPPRSMMGVKQAGQAINISNAEPRYMSTGAEHIIAQETNSKYAFISKKDGRILSIDEKNNLVQILYDDKSTDTINLNPQILPQKEDVIYIKVKLNMNPKYNKRGVKFKANTALAYDDAFFKPGVTGDPIMSLGTYANVAVISLTNTFEDGIVLTSKFADKLDSNFSEQRQLILSPDSTIMEMAKIGDEVEVDTPLVKYSKGSLNLGYASLFSDDGTDAGSSEIAAVTQDAEMDGTIIDINVVYNVPKEELSPSLLKIVNRIEKKKKDIFNSLTEDAKMANTVLFPKEIEGTKYNSVIFDGVLIEFYIEKHVKINLADKVTAVAIKGVVCNIIAYGKEPTTSDGKTVDLFISHDSFISRKVSNVLKEGRLNNILEKMHQNITDALFTK